MYLNAKNHISHKNLTMQSLRLAFPATLLQWSTRQRATAIAVAVATAREIGRHATHHTIVSIACYLSLSFIVCVLFPFDLDCGSILFDQKYVLPFYIFHVHLIKLFVYL